MVKLLPIVILEYFKTIGNNGPVFVLCNFVSYDHKTSNNCLDSFASVRVQRSSIQKRLQTGITFVSRGKSSKAFCSVPVPRATWIKLQKAKNLVSRDPEHILRPDLSNFAKTLMPRISHGSIHEILRHFHFFRIFNSFEGSSLLSQKAVIIMESSICWYKILK